MESNSNNIFIILSILLLATGTSSLKCYKCISLSCPEQHVFCDQVRNFVLTQLPELYYSYNSNVQYCPYHIGSEEGWDILKLQSSTCGEENDGEATCVLGRFQVTTMVTGIGNVTSYGTSLGCARRKLLEYSKSATLRRECSVVTSQSIKKNSLTHFFEIEHCSVVSDMCVEDFCIDPKTSIVKTFRDSVDGNSSVSPLFIAIVVVLIIAFIALVLTVLGIKYN